MERDAREIQRRHLKPCGGSFSLNLPRGWIKRHGIENEVEIVDIADGILIRAVKDSPSTIEDEPEFAQFLAFLTKDAIAHPEALVSPDALLAGIDDLIADVEAL